MTRMKMMRREKGVTLHVEQIVECTSEQLKRNFSRRAPAAQLIRNFATAKFSKTIDSLVTTNLRPVKCTDTKMFAMLLAMMMMLRT